MMNFLEDFVLVNKGAIEKTKSQIKSGPRLILIGLVYGLVFALANLGMISFLQFTGTASPYGFSAIVMMILDLLTLAILSSYLYLIRLRVGGLRSDYKSAKSGMGLFMWEMIRIYFIFWVLSIISELIIPWEMLGYNGLIVQLLIKLSILFFINPILEEIYIGDKSGLEGIKSSINFTLENHLNWIVPNLLIYGLLYLTTRTVIVDFRTLISFISGNYNSILIPEILRGNLFYILRWVLANIILYIGLLYRANLYNILSKSNPRKRRYMGGVKW